MGSIFGGGGGPVAPKQERIPPNRINPNHESWLIHPDKRFDRMNRVPLVDQDPDRIAYVLPNMPHHGMAINPNVQPSLISSSIPYNISDWAQQ